MSGMVRTLLFGAASGASAAVECASARRDAREPRGVGLRGRWIVVVVEEECDADCEWQAEEKERIELKGGGDKDEQPTEDFLLTAAIGVEIDGVAGKKENHRDRTEFDKVLSGCEKRIEWGGVDERKGEEEDEARVTNEEDESEALFDGADHVLLSIGFGVSAQEHRDTGRNGKTCEHIDRWMQRPCKRIVNGRVRSPSLGVSTVL
jgi:hypothetical protein